MTAPDWFSTALAAPVTVREVAVEGTPVAYRAWGPSTAAGIVLVHGGAAHSRWWDHVAPLLAAGRRVVALDLTGHGDSGRRPRYDLDVWSREVMAVAADAGITAPTLIGHSMGGFVTLRAAGLFGARLAGTVAIDSPVRDMPPEERAARDRRAFGPLRVYPSPEAAIARFRPVPAHGPNLDFVVAHVAATSIRAVDGGWTWKFDPVIFRRAPLTPSLLQRLDCRVALFRAEHGMLSPEMTDTMYDRLGRAAPVIDIPAAGPIRAVDGGWTWKFDPVIFRRAPLTPSLLQRLDCRVALFRAEHGMLSPEMTDTMYDRLGRAAPVIDIPAAGHHVMLDQPLALVTGIRTLLSDWDHSRSL